MIGYYVHHHGLGHLTRARCIANASALPVTVLSSLPAPADLGGFAGWVQLPRDDDPPPTGDPTAGGALHWAPTRHPGYTERMRAIDRWVERTGASTLVVDLSVEVAASARLAGLPVVVMASPGDRRDAAHRLAYQLADAVIAPWAADVYRPAHLDASIRVHYVGAISRYDGRVPAADATGRAVLVLLGKGGHAVSGGDVDLARKATPDWDWTVAGGSDWVEDVWTALSRASVVVCHGGQNTLAEVAAARRPAIVVPQERPFGEQHATASALAAAGIATSVAQWPEPDRWAALLDDAVRRGGAGWAAWSDGHGAMRAAQVIADVAAA